MNHNKPFLWMFSENILSKNNLSESTERFSKSANEETNTHFITFN